MNLNSIKEGGKLILRKVEAKAPEILLGTSIMSGVATVVLASIKTLELPDILAEHAAERENLGTDANRKDIAKLYIKTAGKVAKNYAIPAATVTDSIISRIGMYSTMKQTIKRSALYASAISEAYAAYRARTAEVVGEEQEKDIYAGLKKQKVEMTETGEDGKEKKAKKEVKVFQERPHGRWDRFIDETNQYWGTLWKKDPYLNKNELIKQEDKFCDLLASRGVVFMGDVLPEWGFDIENEDKDMWKWGWDKSDLYNERGERKVHPIDFGIFDGFTQSQRDFVNGFEPAILLTPNCHLLRGWGY
jgi:hypothetical protein